MCLLPFPTGSSAAVCNQAAGKTRGASANASAKAVPMLCHPSGLCAGASQPLLTRKGAQALLQAQPQPHPWVAEGRNSNREEPSFYLELEVAPSSDYASFK